MINGGNNGISGDYSFGKLGTGQLNHIPIHPQAVDRSELGRTHMETEGRGYSNFYRNTSEELFLKSFVENSVGMPATNMEMLGFKNLSQNFRANSEELFKNWLTNGEVFLGESYYADRTCKQTIEILKRRGKALESQVGSVKAVMKDLKTEVSFFDATAAEAAVSVKN